MGAHGNGVQAKRQYWRGHFAAWRRSGLSQREYCNNEGLSLSTFQLWRRHLADETTGTEAGSCVDLVALPQTTRSFPPAPSLRLAIGNGYYRLDIGDDVRVDTLRTVLDALESRQ